MPRDQVLLRCLSIGKDLCVVKLSRSPLALFSMTVVSVKVKFHSALTFDFVPHSGCQLPAKS